MLCCGRVWGFRLSEKKENERRSEAEKEQAAELWNSVKKVRLVGKKQNGLDLSCWLGNCHRYPGRVASSLPMDFLWMSVRYQTAIALFNNSQTKSTLQGYNRLYSCCN